MASERTFNAKSSTVVKMSSVSEEGVCELCYHDTRDWAVGECDHPTCLRCLTKIRRLCGQKECPVCRLTLKKVCTVNSVFCIVCPSCPYCCGCGHRLLIRPVVTNLIPPLLESYYSFPPLTKAHPMVPAITSEWFVNSYFCCPTHVLWHFTYNGVNQYTHTHTHTHSF